MSEKRVLLNCRQLAEYLGVSPGYVSAMRRAGFQFTHAVRTVPESADRWLAENPGFRMSKVYSKGKRS